MSRYKTQLTKILDIFITCVVFVFAVTIVCSGVAISKINSEYMSTGVQATRIVAERENKEIFFSFNEKKISTSENLNKIVKETLHFAPIPINSFYIIYENICNIMNDL